MNSIECEIISPPPFAYRAEAALSPFKASTHSRFEFVISPPFQGSPTWKFNGQEGNWVPSLTPPFSALRIVIYEQNFGGFSVRYNTPIDPYEAIDTFREECVVEI